jgi:purine-nucleoside/S-methyl-5'-thioadenosine phosphorylase / adenosine deaminase
LTPPFLEGPILEADTWVWQARRGDVEVRFTGRGPARSREEALQAIAPSAPPLAWAKQVHSAVALPARPGACGEGDALFAENSGLALSVATADCVPVLIAGPQSLAAIHAGWRGIAGGVIPATVEKLKRPPKEWTAWIGPAIGVCCYEVGDEVAEQVVAASAPEVAVQGPAGRPHLDLPGAAQIQLAAAGVGEVIVLSRCTQCDEEKLWSYRREGKRAGRNLAFIWRAT